MQKSKQTKKCEVCCNLRPLSSHLYELSEYCNYLNNIKAFKDKDSNTNVSSVIIGDWLKLASQLEKVEINTWKFADDSGFCCGTMADRQDSDSKHFSDYSTVLIKFIFVCNSLEETYRFVASNYDELPEIKKIPENRRFQKPSMKAAYLVDKMRPAELPTDFDHFFDKFLRFFELYQDRYSPEMSGMQKVKKTDISFGLHLVRNLRNHVAHGVFPLIDNPEYYFGDEGLKEYLMKLLLGASRIGGNYIQMLMSKFNSGFQSAEYQHADDTDEDDSEYFLRNCTVDYGLRLHKIGEFSFENPFNYKS